jgi:vacuolar-type H+-ATPase catalytic subunit A/Vma1
MTLGILETIFDGIQRPLKTIATLSKSVFVPRGVDVASLDQDKLWEFTPKNLKPGQLIVGGDILGTVFENDLFNEHGIMVSPKVTGRVVEIMPAGMYNVSQPIAVLDTNKG